MTPPPLRTHHVGMVILPCVQSEVQEEVWERLEGAGEGTQSHLAPRHQLRKGGGPWIGARGQQKRMFADHQLHLQV